MPPLMGPPDLITPACLDSILPTWSLFPPGNAFPRRPQPPTSLRPSCLLHAQLATPAAAGFKFFELELTTEMGKAGKSWEGLLHLQLPACGPGLLASSPQVGGGEWGKSSAKQSLKPTSED